MKWTHRDQGVIHASRLLLVMVMGLSLLSLPNYATAAIATNYYVSSSVGNDSNDGLSESTPFKTIAKVNSLALQPGDQVRFKCGDTWRAEQLVISHSGNPSASILFGSYPDGCANPPVLSGSKAISGWSLHSANIYVSTLSNSDFPMGLNQLFRNGTRLRLGSLAQPRFRQWRLFVCGRAQRWQQPNQRQRAALRDQLDGGYCPPQKHPLVDARPAGDRLQRNDPDAEYGIIMPGLRLGSVHRLGLFH